MKDLSSSVSRPASVADKQSKKILKEYGKIQQWAAKAGIEMQDDDEAMGLPLLFAVIVLLPLVALVYDGRLVASVPADRYFDFLLPAEKLLGNCQI